MPDANYPRGSEWRKWDLHLHTPKSGSDYGNSSVTATSIVAELDKHKVACVAVTDHHAMDAEYISDLRAESAKLSTPITIFPGMEFRTGSGTGENIHIIGIFSDKLTKEQISHVENDLLTKLAVLSQRQSGRGADAIYVDLNRAIELIHEHDGLVSIHAGRKQNGIEEITNSLEVCQAIKEDIAQKIDIFEMGKAEDFDVYRTKVFPSIKIVRPMIWASDNHNIAKYAATAHKFAWIKADPTFEGLRQITNEPDTRVFIGDEPPSLAQQKTNPTKIIKQVDIRVVAASPLKDETWFDQISVPLNPELVAIIGNKGSGKSALSDVLGLLGNSAQIEHFSFLHPKKFKKEKKAAHFEAQLYWADGSISKWTNLADDEDIFSIERVKYIPQLYLENICSEIASNVDKGESSFYAELEQVIFSHIPSAEQLECASLRDLIGKKTAQTKELISKLIGKLWDKNKLIVSIEDKSTGEHKSILQSKYEAKQKELAAIDARKPQEKLPPSSDAAMSSEMQTVASSLETKQGELEKINEVIRLANSQLAATTAKHAKLEEIKSKITIFSNYLAEFKEDLKADLAAFDLSLESVVKISSPDISTIVKLIEQEAVTKTATVLLLDPKNPQSHIATQRKLQAEIKILELQLAAPQREYQAYLAELKKWKAERNAILGESPDSAAGTDTIRFYRDELAALELLPAEYQKLKEDRTQIVLEIFKEKNNLCECLRRYCKYAQSSLADYDVAQENGLVEFHVAIAENGFVDGFLDHIHQKKSGSFQGQEGRQKLTQLLKDSNFSEESGIKRFIQELETLLAPVGGAPKATVRSQLRQNFPIEDFYKYIYSLEYLKPEYSIRWDGKPLESLSAGERGNLLLIFFLLIAKDPRPLIIDQPEDNLDNQTIYKTLVPCINEAKKHRQIIMVTHNPNLAVVCDADQIIYSKIEKDNKNKVIYDTGAIENPILNKHILDVLEGTRPAFDSRDHKYQQKSV